MNRKLPIEWQMKNCESCGSPFECQANNPGVKCWCMNVPVVKVPAAFSNCLCEKCLRQLVDASAGPALVENVDYYLGADGLLVFTEAYHIKRGSCCNSGCRHCPYQKTT